MFKAKQRDAGRLASLCYMLTFLVSSMVLTREWSNDGVYLS